MVVSKTATGAPSLPPPPDRPPPPADTETAATAAAASPDGEQRLPIGDVLARLAAWRQQQGAQPPHSDIASLADALGVFGWDADAAGGSTLHCQYCFRKVALRFFTQQHAAQQHAAATVGSKRARA